MLMADVRLERDDVIVLAVLTGEIDMSNATSVRQQLAEFVTPEDDALIVDLSELSFIDSAGLHAVIELGTMLEERRQQLVLCVPVGSQTRRAIEIIGIPHTVSVHSEREAAMEAARATVTGSRPIAPDEDA
jgi:anti-anti-sigma factor